MRQRYLLASSWLVGPTLVLAAVLGTAYAHWPVAAAALLVAYVPSAIGGNLGALDARARLRLRAALDFLTAAALTTIVVFEHATMPTWLVIAAGVFAAWSAASGALLFYIWRRLSRAAAPQVERSEP